MRAISSVFLQILPVVENVVRVLRHFQRFLDGVDKVITSKPGVFEHGQLDLYKVINSCLR